MVCSLIAILSNIPENLKVEEFVIGVIRRLHRSTRGYNGALLTLGLTAKHLGNTTGVILSVSLAVGLIVSLGLSKVPDSINCIILQKQHRLIIDLGKAKILDLRKETLMLLGWKMTGHLSDEFKRSSHDILMLLR